MGDDSWIDGWLEAAYDERNGDVETQEPDDEPDED